MGRGSASSLSIQSGRQYLFSYDDTATVKLKTKYAIEKDLGGIMFWQLGNDTKEENSLRDAIYQAAQSD